jgi:hypothetical protein
VTFLQAWLLLPIALAAVAHGLGLLVERLAGLRLPGPLVPPLGLAALIVVATTCVSWGPTVVLATPLVVVLAVVGLVVGDRRLPRLRSWPVLGAALAFACFAAPVVLTGHPTFAGYLKLDDTATWLGIADVAMHTGRDLSDLPTSTFQLNQQAYVGTGYPLGSFVGLGVAARLGGVDVAWAFHPFLTVCGATIALTAYALMDGVVPSRRVRAVAAAVAAQPALLYGYTLWGGIKEMVIALLVVLLVAVAAATWARRPGTLRDVVPVAVVAGALTAVIGPSSIVWIAPVLGVLVARWLWEARATGAALGHQAARTGVLAGAVLLCSVPMLSVLRRQIDVQRGFSSASEANADALGNLTGPLKLTQLAGPWPVGDFRDVPSTLHLVLLLVVVGLAAVAGLVLAVRARRVGVGLYLLVALLAVAVAHLTHQTTWVLGKTLTTSSPAILLCAVVGAGALWSRRRAVGVVLLAVVAGGVLWSNALAYAENPVAPYDRLAELAHVGELTDGEGPLFDNEYEPYATRHLLRDAAPIQPAEYRPATLPLLDGYFLVKPAFADIDAFPGSTLAPYRSIVVPRSPTSSRPPGDYREVWSGRWYRLFEKDDRDRRTVLRHVPFGDSVSLPYCGNAQNGPSQPRCPQQPIAVPPCATLRALGREAAAQNATLRAFSRPAPIPVHADESLWPGAWAHDPGARTLTPTAPGTARFQIRVAVAATYELWLQGSFQRGFEVTVDGRDVGRVRDELGFYVSAPLTRVRLTPGVHAFAVTAPGTSLAPASGDGLRYTRLDGLTLQQTAPDARMLELPAKRARELCGRPLDWVELVR